jgi:hypothetical protein
MLRRMWVLLCAGLTASACAAGGMDTAPATIYPPAAYSQRVATNDVTIYWSCTREATQVRFEGVVQNARGGAVKFMELELAGADARDRYVSEARTALKDIVLQTNQIASFVIQLRPTGGESRFDLFYRYQVDSAIGGDERPRFRALDVCSPTRHRFRK